MHEGIRLYCTLTLEGPIQPSFFVHLNEPMLRDTLLTAESYYEIDNIADGLKGENQSVRKSHETANRFSSKFISNNNIEPIIDNPFSSRGY